MFELNHERVSWFHENYDQIYEQTFKLRSTASSPTISKEFPFTIVRCFSVQTLYRNISIKQTIKSEKFMKITASDIFSVVVLVVNISAFIEKHNLLI